MQRARPTLPCSLAGSSKVEECVVSVLRCSCCWGRCQCLGWWWSSSVLRRRRPGPAAGSCHAWCRCMPNARSISVHRGPVCPCSSPPSSHRCRWLCPARLCHARREAIVAEKVEVAREARSPGVAACSPKLLPRKLLLLPLLVLLLHRRDEGCRLRITRWSRGAPAPSPTSPGPCAWRR